jgi:hypothetical protein
LDRNAPAQFDVGAVISVQDGSLDRRRDPMPIDTLARKEETVARKRRSNPRRRPHAMGATLRAKTRRDKRHKPRPRLQARDQASMYKKVPG